MIGKGTYKWKSSGAIYDGDWKDDKRSGFGTYSIPQEDGNYQKQYSGGWKNDRKHVMPPEHYHSLLFVLFIYLFIFIITFFHLKKKINLKKISN